jgi:hypothetical protein
MEEDFQRAPDKRMKGKPKKDKRSRQSLANDRAKGRANNYDGRKPKAQKQKKGRREL